MEADIAAVVARIAAEAGTVVEADMVAVRYIVVVVHMVPPAVPVRLAPFDRSVPFVLFALLQP